MPLVDFHCHLTEAGGYAALPAATGSLFDSPVAVVSVTNRPVDWRAMVRSIGRHPVAWGLGLHPELVHDAKAVKQFVDALPSAEVIGEVGLDYSAQARATEAAQRRTFDAVLGAPEAARRLVSIHSRGATRDVVAALRGHDVPGAVLHWFLGAAAEIDEAVDLDVFFSVNQAMLSRTHGKGVVAALPPNRVVLETDAPYGGPAGRPSAPGHLDHVVAGLGRVWHRPVDEVRALVESNQRHLLARVDVTPLALRTAVHADPGHEPT